MIRSGLHGPNAAFIAQDYAALDLMRAQALKLMYYHTTQDVNEARVHGVCRFLVRLQDSVWEDRGRKYVPSAWDYGDALLERILYFYRSAAILDFQVDNEPNISWKQVNLTNWVYRAFMHDVLEYIQPKLPDRVRLGFPSVSFALEHTPMDWLGVMRDLAERFDFLTVNSYWQSGRVGRDNILAGPMTWSQFGGNCKWYEDWLPGKPIQIAEYGNSIHEQGLFTPAQVDAFRMEQYPLYLEWLAHNHPSVEAAYCYIAPGATQDWQGFKVTPPVAAAMGMGRMAA